MIKVKTSSVILGSGIYFSDQNLCHIDLAELTLTFFFVWHFCHRVRKGIWLQNSTIIRKHNSQQRIPIGKVASFTLILFVCPNSSTYYRWWRQINASKCYLEIFREEAWIVWKKPKGRSRNRYANSNGWRHNAGVCPKSLWSQFCKL